MSSLKAGVIREQVSEASELLVTITNDWAMLFILEKYTGLV